MAPFAVGQFTVTDLNDVNISTTEPSSPVVDQLWLDTSIVPNQLKRWNGSGWDDILPEGIQESINSKADQNRVDDIEDTVNDYITTAPTKSQYEGLFADLTAYKLLLEQDSIDINDAKNAISSLLARTVTLELDLYNTVQKWNFIDTYMVAGEEGLYIGANDGSVGIRIGVDPETQKGRIDFLDGNGMPVAHITNQLMKIDRGIFVESAQIGEHKIETIDDGITIFTWVPPEA